MAAPTRRKRKKATARRTAPATAIVEQGVNLPALDPKLEIHTPEEITSYLSPRHQAFVAKYCQLWNGTRAYKAIYGEHLDDNVAGVSAHHLLKNPKIKAAVFELTRRVADEAEISIDFVLRGAKEVLDRSLSRVPVMYFDKEKKMMVQETEMVQGEDGEWREEGVWKFDANGSMRALELLAKHTGGFTGDDDAGKGKGGVTNNFYFEYAGQRIYF